jgi:succinate dehydrogenase / fumarate reductase cytochrome b subunit
MNDFLDFYNSSVGKKVLMSVTGIFLIVFLVEHLLGNLLLFADDGGVKYEAYGEFLLSNPVIRAVEYVLALAVFVHIVIGVALWIKNRKTRPVRYKFFRIRENSPLSSRTVIVSGTVVGLFLYIHLKTFFYPMRFLKVKLSSYELVVNAFSDPWYVVIYLAAFVVLGYHLKHGFQSAFQTLGLRQKKYIKFLDMLAFIVWFLIPLGYTLIPVYFLFFHKAAAVITTGAN